MKVLSVSLGPVFPPLDKCRGTSLFQIEKKHIYILNSGITLAHIMKIFEPVHDISNNVVCATSKASDQPAHMRSLIRAFASRLSIL